MPDHASLRPASSSATITTTSSNMRLVIDEPADGTELVRVVRGSSPPSTVQVRFEPLTPSDHLSGKPEGWCNSPSAGQPLIFDVPAPSPGAPPVTGDLTVDNSSTAGPPVRIPITVKHGI